MGAIFEPPAPPTDCFIVALLAMTFEARPAVVDGRDKNSAEVEKEG